MSKFSRKKDQLGLIGLSLLLFLLSTAGALGLVWLRQQISRTAKSCIAKEKEIAIAQRKNSYLHSKIAQIHNPEYLKEQLESKFALPCKKQIVWMNSDEVRLKVRHLALKNKNRKILVEARYNERS